MFSRTPAALLLASFFSFPISKVFASPLTIPPSSDVSKSSPSIHSNSSAASGKNGAVASEIKECSDIGVEVLKEGGNAADAIMATSLCVGVISAYHSGIGGGGFMIVRSPNKNRSEKHEYEMIDFRETMPAAGNETMYVDSPDPTASTIGGLAVGVPGELRGWEMLHKRHGSGKVSWRRLFEPAIKLARDGFLVNIDLANELDTDENPFLLNDTLWAETYAPEGKILKQGDTAYRKRYANTLEQISLLGPDAFYHGKFAEGIAKAAQARGGVITTEDIANYSAIIREPVSIDYRGHRIFSTVAPSSGATVLSALKIFEGYPGSALPSDSAINLTTHRLIQATKFAYGQRTNYGDPAFTSNVTTLETEYIKESTAKEIRAKIKDNETFPASYYDPTKREVKIDHGTSHLAAADKDGIVISLTTTVNLIWGSQVMTEDGIILNDEMDDFSSPDSANSFGYTASPINFIRPGKRPQSSISSSIVEDGSTGKFITATGSAGGSRIITATLENLHHVLDQHLTAEQSVHQSRWHDQLGNVTYFEYRDEDVGIAGFSNSTVGYLENIGYNITYEDTTGSTSHVITRDNHGLFTAASDPRKAAGKGAAF